MSKYYSNTLRIISIITLIAFVSTQTALGYESRAASAQPQKSHLRSEQFLNRGNSVASGEVRGAATGARSALRVWIPIIGNWAVNLLGCAAGVLVLDQAATYLSMYKQNIPEISSTITYGSFCIAINIKAAMDDFATTVLHTPTLISLFISYFFLAFLLRDRLQDFKKEICFLSRVSGLFLGAFTSVTITDYIYDTVDVAVLYCKVISMPIWFCASAVALPLSVFKFLNYLWLYLFAKNGAGSAGGAIKRLTNIKLLVFAVGLAFGGVVGGIARAGTKSIDSVGYSAFNCGVHNGITAHCATVNLQEDS